MLVSITSPAHPPYIIIWFPLHAHNMSGRYMQQTAVVMWLKLCLVNMRKLVLLFQGLVIYTGEIQSRLRTEIFI